MGKPDKATPVTQMSGGDTMGGLYGQGPAPEVNPDTPRTSTAHLAATPGTMAAEQTRSLFIFSFTCSWYIYTFTIHISKSLSTKCEDQTKVCRWVCTGNLERRCGCWKLLRLFKGICPNLGKSYKDSKSERDPSNFQSQYLTSLRRFQMWQNILETFSVFIMKDAPLFGGGFIRFLTNTSNVSYSLTLRHKLYFTLWHSVIHWTNNC